MSLNRREIAQLAGIVRGLVKDLQAPVAIADQATFLPVLSDLTNTAATGLTRAQMAALVNRFYAEQPGAGTPPALAES